MNETQLNKMFDRQFSKFFRYMRERFDELDVKLEAKANRKQSEQTLRVLDAVVARLDDIKVDMAAQNHQLNSHEAWIKRAANKIKVSYESAI